MEGQVAKNDPPNDDQSSSNGCSGSGTSTPSRHDQHDAVAQQSALDGLGADDAGDNDNTSVDGPGAYRFIGQNDDQLSFLKTQLLPFQRLNWLDHKKT